MKGGQTNRERADERSADRSGFSIARWLLLLLAGVSLFAAAAATLAVSAEFIAVLRPLEEARQALVAQRLADGLQGAVDDLRADVLVARRAAPAERALGAPDNPAALAARDATARLFAAQLEVRPAYLQLRLIRADAEGRELVRVERDSDGAVRIVEHNGLQAKGERSYMRAGARLTDGAVHVSPLELNQEHGRVESPAVPVLRTTTPVFVDGLLAGLVVLNADMRAPLARVRDGAGAAGTTLLIDELGGFVVHPNPAREFALERGLQDAGLAAEYPELAWLVDAEQPTSLRIEGPDGHLLVNALPTVLADGPRLTLFTITEGANEIVAGSTRRVAMAVGLIVAGVSAVLAFALGGLLTRPLGQMAEAAGAIPADGPLDLPRKGPKELMVLSRALQRANRSLGAQRASLAAEEQRFRSVVQASPAALLLIDRAGTIALANRRAEELFGYEAESLVGQPVQVLVPEALREVHPTFVTSYFENPSPRRMAANRELQGRRLDGSAVSVEIGLSPIEGPEGLFVLAAVNDVTERKAWEAELKRSNEELAQFAHVASHDLQEPLRMVANYTELLSRRYAGQLDERADRYIHYAADGARRMQKLVRDLLAYSRVDTQGKALKLTDSGVVLNRVVRSLRAQVKEAGATVEHTDMPMVMADEVQLGQVFQNLISNGVKFRGDEPPRVHVSASRDGGHWVFSVSDNGIGIDPQQAPRLFQMFQRLNPTGRYSGSGIGLALARRIVTRHGGELWYSPSEPPGATFHFTLPGEETS